MTNSTYKNEHLHGFALAAASLCLATFGAGCSAPEAPRATAPVEPQADEPLLPDERRRIEVFRRACPSIVHVETLEVWRDPAQFNVLEIPVGMGSGFVWDRVGHIVTNLHVIRGGDEVRVSLKDGRTWVARVMGSDPAHDVAVLMIDAPGDALEPIQVDPTVTIQVGQTVLALGNPFGLDHTLTVGVISALGRELRTESGSVVLDVIQTDAAINPGSSGGPLLDSGGRLLGVNTALTSPSGAFAGIGFAVPVGVVDVAVRRILGLVPPQRVGLGVRVADDAWLAQLGLSGALIMEVRPGGPAEQAGLRPTRRPDHGAIELGDLIVSVDGAQVRSGADLASVLEAKGPGRPLVIGVQRDATVREFTMVGQLERHRGAEAQP